MDQNGEMNEAGSQALITVVVGFLIGAVLAWIYWLQRQDEEKSIEPDPMEGARVMLEPGLAQAPVATAGHEELGRSALSRIQGVGPRVSEILNQAGILSYRQLAEADPEDLRSILREHGLQFINPGTWPQQAALAASGDWRALDDFQATLSAGRRDG